MAEDFELDTDDLGRRMDGAIANLRVELASLRTGRASGSMLEPIMVVVLGLIVGFIVIALFLPLIKLLNDLS